MTFLFPPGQRDSRVMSEVPSDEDHQTSTNSNTNVDSAEVLNQSRRDLLKNEQPNEEGGDKLLKNISFSVKVQQDGDKEKVNSEGDREEDGEEDTDEVMKVGEEEELSTQKHLPMTDSPHPDTGRFIYRTSEHSSRKDGIFHVRPGPCTRRREMSDEYGIKWF